MSDKKSPDEPQRRAGAKKHETPDLRKVDRFSSDFDFLLINSPIYDELHPQIVTCVTSKRKNPNVVFAVVTYGGMADVAYKIGRYLQSVYDDVVAFVPTACKSAGTLLVTSAKSVVMTPFGELGPLDVQLRQRDEIFGRRSGLITRAAISDLKVHAFELFKYFMYQITDRSQGSISFKASADVAARTTSEIMGRIYEQINPDMLGQDFRDLSVATEYCTRLNERFKNVTTRGDDPEHTGVGRLVHGYPSHDFVIDFEEARGLFERVELPGRVLYKIMRARLNELALPRPTSSRVVDIFETSEYAHEPESTPPATEGSHKDAAPPETAAARDPRRKTEAAGGLA